jgi:hypothetical protein
MKANKKTVLIIILIVLLGGISVAKVAGLWTTTGKKFVSTNTEISHDIVDGEHEEEIRINGFTTFEDLFEYGFTKESINGIFGFEVEEYSGSLKDYCNSNDMEFSEVKDLFSVELEKILNK